MCTFHANATPVDMLGTPGRPGSWQARRGQAGKQAAREGDGSLAPRIEARVREAGARRRADNLDNGFLRVAPGHVLFF